MKDFEIGKPTKLSCHGQLAGRRWAVDHDELRWSFGFQFIPHLLREIHQPDVGLCRDVGEIERTVVSRKRGTPDVHILIGDYKYLMILSRLRVKQIDRSLAHKQKMPVVIEPNGPIAEVRQPIIGP